MKRAILFLSIVTLIAAGCNQQPASQAPAAASSSTANAAASGPFTAQELTQFAALDPIDTHTHLYQSAPVLTAMLRRLNLRVVDILVS
jgi:hypothetical protein